MPFNKDQKYSRLLGQCECCGMDILDAGGVFMDELCPSCLRMKQINERAGKFLREEVARNIRAWSKNKS